MRGTFTVVHVDASLSAPQKLAVQACAGLRNRSAGGSVYVDSDPHDATWLSDLGLVPAATVGAREFLTSCVSANLSCVRYDYESQQALLPNSLPAHVKLVSTDTAAKLALAVPR